MSAVNDVLNGKMTSLQASRLYKVPHTTLRRYRDKVLNPKTTKLAYMPLDKNIVNGYSTDDLKKAIAEVLKGEATHVEASERFSVPLAVLRDNVNNILHSGVLLAKEEILP